MLLSNLNLLATAPGGVARLRELILTLAVQGKLVPQDPADEPASVLLQKIRAEKDRLIAEGKIKKDKPLPPIAEEEKPFELQVGWEWVRFGDVTLISSGVTLGRKTVISLPVILPYLRVANVQRWHVDLTSMKEIVIDRSELARFQLVNGDLLITEGGDWDKVGRTAIWRDELPTCLHQNHVFKVRGTCPEWNALWAQLFLNSPVARAYFAFSAKQTTNLASINMTELKNCVFPLPPLAEQSRIVTRVEELMRLCDALEAKGQLEATQHAQLLSTLLGTLTASATPEELAAHWQRVAQHFDLLLDRPEAIDALEQTLLQLAVRGLLVPQDPADEPASVLLQKIRAQKDRLIAEGKIKKDKPLAEDLEEKWPFKLPPQWTWVRLIDLMPEFQNGASSRGDAGGTPITVLRLADIKGKRISLAETRQVPIAPADIAKYRLAQGDILITRVNGSADIVGQFNLCDRPVDAIYCDHFIRMRINQLWIEPSFCALLGDSALVRTAIKSLFITTAGQKTVNQGHIGSLQLPLPPLAEQSRIVTRVTQLRRLCADLRQRLAEREAVQARLAEALVQQVA